MLAARARYRLAWRLATRGNDSMALLRRRQLNSGIARAIGVSDERRLAAILLDAQTSALAHRGTSTLCIDNKHVKQNIYQAITAGRRRAWRGATSRRAICLENMARARQHNVHRCALRRRHLLGQWRQYRQHLQ
jgi:hypothetical protein